MSRLMIPVQLDVLLVREAGGRFADAAMAEPASEDLLHKQLWKAPFSERANGRPRGAYLHWALPDALTHGTVDVNGELAFPAIPDRWLVVRLSPSTQASRRAVRGWVIESDRGVTRDLDGWVEPGGAPAGRNPLTALGHGDPAWAAYFDNVVNRLAFYDDLKDLPVGPITYLVSGWFASNSLDPLADPQVFTRAHAHARLEELRWRIAGGGESESPPIPVATGALFHGAAVGLSWPSVAGGTPEVGGPPSATSMRIVLAGTTCEALATLVARSDDEVRVLEAASLGILGELAEPDGRARLDAALHASAFGSLPGGDVVERVVQPEPPPAPPAPAASRTNAPVARRTPPETATRRFVSADLARESVILPGRLRDVQLQALPAEPPQPPPPAGPLEVRRSLPRFFHPTDPVLLVQGGRRSFKHGGDGRFTKEGVLACRMSGATVKELHVADPRTAGARLVVRGESLLERRLANRAVPAECEDLLDEIALLDPGGAPAAARTLLARSPAAGAVQRQIEQRIAVEQTAWWALRDSRVDPAGILAQSGLSGVLPSPLAVTPAARPWTPLHLEWRAEYEASSHGARDWVLGDVDLDPTAVETAAPLVLEGRALVTPAPAEIAASTARRTVRSAARVASAIALPAGAARARFVSDLAQTLTERAGALEVAGDDGNLDVTTALGQLDVLSGTLDPLHAGLRGGVAFDEPASDPAGPVVALRAGLLRLTRLRLVDGFGQFVDLLADEGAPAARLDVAETLRLPDRPGRAALAPRLTAPARLMLRYTDAAGNDAGADEAASPVAGFLMPNHLDEALEIFDATGKSRGSLRAANDGGVVFEASPGVVTTLSGRPLDALGNETLAGFVEGLLDWGIADAAAESAEGALPALLRLVDSVRWSVDPQGQGADEDLGPLVGRPLAVLTARACLEVAPEDAARLELVELPLRLGSLAHFQDGLHGVFVEGDYRKLLVSGAAAGLAREMGPGRGYLQQAPAVADHHARFAEDIAGTGDGASPVTHPYFERDSRIALRPGRDVRLTLLVEPYGLVYATTGFLPRKEIGMRREWIAGGLARLAPTFRFGPLLVDPKRVRLPVAREAEGTWSFAHRIDASTWEEEPVIDAASQTAPVGGTAVASEGWLRFQPGEETSS